MPRNVDITFKQEKAKQENAPLFLYTLEAYDGVNDLHLAGFDQDVTYDGVLYSKFPITHEFISENNQGQIDQVKVRLGNVSRLIELYLEQYDFRASGWLSAWFGWINWRTRTLTWTTCFISIITRRIRRMWSLL